MSDQVIIMRPDELRDMFNELRRELIEEIRNVQPKTLEKSVTAKEIAAYLKIDVSTLWRRFKDGKYPTELIHRDAGRPKFYKTEFEAYIKGN